MKAPVVIACMAFTLISTAYADVGAPPAGPPLEDLPLTTLTDKVFTLTGNQTLDEESGQLCVFDQNGLAGKGLCKTNIGYYIAASGWTYDAINDDPRMQFYIRFQMPDSCHGATVDMGDGNLQCAELAADWSRFPQEPKHAFNVSTLCKDIYDPVTSLPVGCGNNYEENPCCSVDSYEDWANWNACQDVPDIQTDPYELNKDQCRQLLFMQRTGWNYTVLFRMVDLILQNGNDCQKTYEQKRIGADPATFEALCVDGDVPAPAVHPVLAALQRSKSDDNGKEFYGTFDNPLDKAANFMPPPPYSPPPPPGPPVVIGKPPPLSSSQTPGGAIGGTNDARTLAASWLIGTLVLAAMLFLS